MLIKNSVALIDLWSTPASGNRLSTFICRIPRNIFYLRWLAVMMVLLNNLINCQFKFPEIYNKLCTLNVNIYLCFYVGVHENSKHSQSSTRSARNIFENVFFEYTKTIIAYGKSFYSFEEDSPFSRLNV